MTRAEPADGAGVDVTAVEGPEWTRLLERAHRQLERHDGVAGGTVTLTNPTDEERRLVIGLTGTYRRGDVKTLQVDMRLLAKRVQALTGADLVTICQAVHGRAVRHRATERATEEAARQLLAETLSQSQHCNEPWHERWRQTLLHDGTLTRLVRSGQQQLVRDLVAVLDALPAADVPLQVLAERSTGHTKALSSGTLPALVLSALAQREGLPAPENVEERRALWDGAGVIVDDLASHVLVAGLRTAAGSPLADELAAAARRGHPRRVTLFELTHGEVHLGGAEVWVCENPSVFRAALTALGAQLPPLVCAEGHPSSACWRLLRRAVADGSRVHWRNDFDYTGLRMTETAVRRLGAEPWRMSQADLCSALAAGGPGTEELKGTAPARPSWDDDLLPAVQRAGIAVMEERLVEVLISDLRSATAT